MTECSLLCVQFPNETRDITLYMEYLHEIFAYLSELFIQTSPLDEKMNVIVGMSTYSYKRFKEIYEHELYNTVSGRNCTRVLIEVYIMMKYLILKEHTHDNIWRDYQLYGLGAYKKTLLMHREKGINENTHFDAKYIEALVNEFTDEEFIDIDLRYFGDNIRDRAKAVNENDLYSLYYDYDSSFEHGLWGAVREAALVKCTNPAHQYHCVPDVDENIRLKSVLPDCIMVMNKIISFLDEQFGIPENLFKAVINFEIESLT